jgi:cytoskeletal protein CcmA (bactofilin family)
MAWFDRNPGGRKSPENERSKVAAGRPVITLVSTEPASSAESPMTAAPSEPTGLSHVGETARAGEAGLVASLHKGCRVTGQLTFQGPARIDGSVEGEIQCHGKLTIGEGAEVRANIASALVVIHGRVEGDVTATEMIELVAPARLYGNIATPRLIIAEGVVFDGDCSMGVITQQGGIVSS